jgi:hypothetical protein
MSSAPKSAKPIVPTEVNPLYADKFKFVLLDAKNVEFFCFRANLPGISMNTFPVQTPVNPHFVGGKKLFFEDLQLSFRVSEDLANYKEIFNWMVGITGPQSTEQFKDFNDNKNSLKSGYRIYADATLFSLTNAANPNIIINFRDIFPYSLSGLEMDTTDKQTISASVGFKYNYYEFGDTSDLI